MKLNLTTKNIANKITQRKALEQSNTKCHVCNSHINLDSSSDFVACGSCNHSPICRNLHCAVWSDKLKAWNCKDCRSFSNGSNSACDWLISQLNEKLLQEKGSQKQIIWDASSTNDNGPLIPLEQREKVREFVEELVSTLIGGSIENAPVGQLSEDKECLPTGENETDSIDESHATLKHLVERIIEEVFKFPDFFDRSGVSSQPQAINLPQFDPKKYEELLATAVLNKLVESYSYERRLDNSSGVHSGSDIENNVQSTLEKSRFENSSTSSSNEPRSDSSNSVSLNDQPMSLTATKYIDILSAENSISSQIDSPTRSVDSDEEAYLSDYIQKHQVPLPGIEAHESDSFDEDCETVNSSVTEGNWQENWLFKKRKLKNETAAAIGMLVPSPMEDVKALIGDKTTDEVSDLSEAGSDLEDDEIETLNGRRSADLPHALIDSKTIIGGKNEFGSFTEVKTIDELLQPDSLVSTQSFDSQNPVIMEAKNDLILINEHDTKPIVLQVHEKLNLNNNNNNYDDNNKVSDKDFIQDTPQNTITNQCSEPTAASNVESIFATENGEPPVPTPRKKSKSFDLAKQVTSVEVSTRPIVENNNLSDSKTVVSPIGVDWNVKSEVDELLASKAQPESLDDELLDLSINDIYDSIEGESTIDYQSLVVEDEKIDNEIRAELPSHHLTSEVSNQLSKLVEDGSNEAGSQKLFEESPLTVPSSNISNENYICKVVPNEFDLSVDSVLELKSNVSEVVVPNGIEDRSVSQLVCISGDSELFPTEILSIENSATEVVIENIINSEQSTIPKLIISNICCDTPPPVVEDDDLASLKPKKTLKAQDSLELPKDDRGKFEPTKRVESFDIEDDDKNMTAKISAFGNVVHSISEHVKNDRETSEHVTVDCEKDSVESFVFVTDEEVTVLKLEEQDSLTQSETFIQNENSESEQSLTSELKTLIETQETTNLNVKLDRPQKIQKTKSLLDDEVGDAEETQRTYTSTLEISPQPDLTTPIAVNVSNAVDSSTKSKDSLLSLPPIEESSTQVDTISRPSTLYSTSNLFSTSQAIILDKSTNIEQLNEGPLPGSIAEREHLKWMNAQDIPNNPYSPEALQRRLSQTKSPSKVIDIGLSLASKPNEDLSPKTDIESGKPIQIVLGAGEPDHMRYGRDYYINDSKSASGTRKKTPSVQRYSSTDDDNVSDLDKQTARRTEQASDTKRIDYYRIFENYKSNPVQRSTSLNSLRRYKNTRSSNVSDDELSVKSMTNSFDYRRRRHSNFELPVEVINQLERHTLHGNLRRDSFRSRSGTKNFVLNPIFDERFESEGDDEVFRKTSEIINIVAGDVRESLGENNQKPQPPTGEDLFETVYTDFNNLENGTMSKSNPLRKSKSFKSNQISSHW
ncbi:hypothetical protein Bhyg_08273 [Pseudolycoriella hygida]|uniref:Uncharacterized protein n=1 Tax=Pseudolycoriella hygida TaxID=35572 RepID=A0A9Q0N495_9DIPT|nr:hypothetical protein Bhyg_08273 [Pseudolycoriella hygida]